MLGRRDIPNLLTYARVAAVPVCLALMLVDPPFKAAALFWVFVAASLTDFLDGYLARKWNVVSPIGALLDPVADKLLVALMLVYLLTIGDLTAIAPLALDEGQTRTSFGFASLIFLPVAVILLRELYISGLREFLSARQIALPVSKGGKWKTALQMVSIVILLATHAAYLPEDETGLPDLWVLERIGHGVLYLSALLALTSAISYTRASWKHLRAAK